MEGWIQLCLYLYLCISSALSLFHALRSCLFLSLCICLKSLRLSLCLVALTVSSLSSSSLRMVRRTGDPSPFSTATSTSCCHRKTKPTVVQATHPPNNKQRKPESKCKRRVRGQVKPGVKNKHAILISTHQETTGAVGSNARSPRRIRVLLQGLQQWR